MKKLLFFLFLFCIPFFVSASGAYLEDFQILNGTLSIPFQEKNNIYTVYLNENASKLEFSYHLSFNASVEVLGNEYKDNEENVVVIKVSNKDTLESQSYTFYLEKEESVNASFDSGTAVDLSTKEGNEIPHLKMIVIGICCVFILALFKLLIWNYIKKAQEKL